MLQQLLLIILHILAFVSGLILVLYTLKSAIRTFVLPRSAPDNLSRVVFVLIRLLFNFRLKRLQTYEERDHMMALYAPIALLTLPVAWLTLILIGYMSMFWASGVPSWWLAYNVSGSSLLTLGFAQADDFLKITLTFSEAAIGLILIALLIAYLPTMYSAFSKREAAVTMLEVRAGSPPSAIEMFKRYYRLQRLDKLSEMWVSWELWFVELDESHTSLAALPFFRSPQAHRSWVTAAGAILDAASLAASTIDIPRDAQADLCIRAGFIALHHIASFFQIVYDPHPQAGDPISITREAYDAACDELARAGVPLKTDREQAWKDFAGWRVNYDTVLLALAGLTMAPAAPWSSDGNLRPLSQTLITSFFR
jgi:hypothetical protein